MSLTDELLVVLFYEKELSGLDLLNNLEARGLFPLSYACVYFALNRLIRKGLIEWR